MTEREKTRNAAAKNGAEKNGGGALGRDLREHPREGIGKRHRKKYEQRGGCGRQGGGVLSHASSDGRKNRSSAF